MYSSPKNFKQLRTIIRQNTKRDSCSPIHSHSCLKKNTINNRPPTFSKTNFLKANVSPSRYTSPANKERLPLQQKVIIKKNTNMNSDMKLFGKLRKCISDKKQHIEIHNSQEIEENKQRFQTLSKENIQCNIFEENQQVCPSTFKEIAKISNSNAAMQFSGVTFQNIIRKIDSTRHFQKDSEYRSQNSFNSISIIDKENNQFFKFKKNDKRIERNRQTVLDCNQSLQTHKLCYPLKLKRIQSAVAQMQTINQSQQSNESCEQVNQSKASSNYQLNMDLNF